MRYVLTLLFMLTCTHLLHAGQTGKIRGKVTDSETGEAVIGANVVLEKTPLGGTTDISGAYIVNNIPPGEYRVVVSAVGYKKQVVTNVKIAVDFTTKLDVVLTPEAMQVDPVVVEAKAPLIRTDLTSSQTTIDASQISALPVESVGQLLQLQAGVTQGVGGDLHIRGGRSSEIAFTVNGVSVSNPFDNSATVQIATNAIQELSVISGTFNAEYGNAMSGIVNTVTKEGGSNFNVHIAAYSGDYLSSRTNPFYNISSFRFDNNSVGEFTLSGPIPFFTGSAGFFISGRGDNNRGWLYGIREHNPSDYARVNPMNPNDITIKMTGDRKVVPMNPYASLSGTAKLTIRPVPTFKINYDLIASGGKYKYYSHDYKYNPDALPSSYDLGITHALEARHALSAATFYSLKASYNYHSEASYLYPLLRASDNAVVNFSPGMNLAGLKPDPRYQPEEYANAPTAYTFNFGGTDNNHSYRQSKTYAVKFDIVSQVTPEHELKSGFEVRRHELNNEYFLIRRDTILYTSPVILPITGPYHDLYSKYPEEYAFYMQDKMEFDNLIVNAGIRYDYFNSNSQYPVNTLYPSPNDPQLPPFIDKASLLKDAEGKHQISPRLGISFPITDKGILHFSYGHFFQMPPFSYLYSNSAFKYSYAVATPTFGDANLRPEKTVTYELGLQQQLADNLAFNITGFYKDVRDLLALQRIRVSGDRTYQKYVNKDYGNIKGITFSLTKRRTRDDMLGFTLDYTLQAAEGNDTDADAFFIDLASGRQSEKLVIFLPWDQTHTLNTTVSYGEPGSWSLSVIGKIGTGLPYTPQILAQEIAVRTNSGRRPSTAFLDFMAEKTFVVQDVTFTVFCKVFNLLDVLNERIVYFDTGRSTYTLQQSLGGTKTTEELSRTVPGVHSPAEYFNRPNYYYPPREVRLGVSLDFGI